MKIEKFTGLSNSLITRRRVLRHGIVSGAGLLFSDWFTFRASGGMTENKERTNTMKQPNFLFLFTDQQSFDTLKCFGSPVNAAPNLDALAEKGVIFTNCFTTSPVCEPARASIVTGQFSHAHGCFGNGCWIDHSRPGWPQIFSENGYETAAIGKMHFYPWDLMHGFQKRIIAEDKGYMDLMDDYAKYLKKDNLERPRPRERQMAEIRSKGGGCVSCVDFDHHIDSFVGKEAVKYIKKLNPDKPFFTWVSFNSPHPIFDPPEELAEKFISENLPPANRKVGELETKPEIQGLHSDQYLKNFFGMTRNDDIEVLNKKTHIRRAYYYSVINLVDYWIGEIIKTLKERGLYENTIIIFSSDHGDANGDHWLLEKYFCYDSIIRVPTFFHCPARFSARKVDALIQNTDFLPTFLSLAGLKTPDSSQGKSLLPLLGGEKNAFHRYVYSETITRNTYISMIRDNLWKYVHYTDSKIGELYNLEEDPCEINNLYSESKYREIRAKYAEELLEWKIKTIDPSYKKLPSKFM